MTSDQFRELCRGTAHLLQLSDPDSLFDGADVRIDGVKMGVIHEGDWDQGGIYCYADLGVIESRGLGEVIGMERESRHVVLRATLQAEGDDELIHAGQLAEQLRNYASLADELYRQVLADITRPMQRAA